MTYSKQVTIWCDGEDCGHWDQFGATLTAANKLIIEAGWFRKGNFHLCPKCAKRREGNKS